MARAFSVVNIHLMRARCGVALSFPGGDFGDEALGVVDPAVQALAAQHADLDFDHVEPAGVLGGVVELEAAQDAASFGGREGLVEGAGRVGRQIVQHDADALGMGIVDIDEIAHALGEVFGGAPLGDLDVAPGPVDVDADEEIDRAVAAVLAIVALELARLGRDRLAHLADELGRALVEADHRPLGIGRFGIEVEHVFHAGDIFAIDLGDAPHVPAPRLETVLGQPPAHRLARQALVIGELDHRVGQQLQRPAGAARRRLAQAVATSRASSLPVSFRSAPGRCSSLSARSRLPSTKRRLVRYTVEPPTATVRAISSSPQPASAANRIWARLSLRAARLPLLSSVVSSSRSAWLSSTR